MSPPILFVEEDIEICKALIRNGYNRRQLAKQILVVAIGCTEQEKRRKQGPRYSDHKSD